MNDHDFNELVTYVLETGVHPPKSLFVGGGRGLACPRTTCSFFMYARV